MDVLLIGGTGKVGTHLVSQLVARGAKVRVHGARAEPKDLERLTGLLGRPPRSYRDYVAEAAANLA